MEKKVVIYTTNTCPYCRAAKDFLRSKNVSFEEIDVTRDDSAREKIAALSGRQTVPQIFVDGVSLGGYDELVRFYSEGKVL
jgi:glutaredoxin 3